MIICKSPTGMIIDWVLRFVNDGYLPLLTTNRHNLKILGLISSDSGMFQCVGMNNAGSVQASAFLEVIPIGNFLTFLFHHIWGVFGSCVDLVWKRFSWEKDFSIETKSNDATVDSQPADIIFILPWVNFSFCFILFSFVLHLPSLISFACFLSS